MDPINGVLDETFFKVASPECLTALSKLIDDALAVRFTNYLNSTTVDNPIAAIINNYLGQAIKMATFHMQLLERGSAKVVEKIELETKDIKDAGVFNGKVRLHVGVVASFKVQVEVEQA